jgi:hypothetical protein
MYSKKSHIQEAPATTSTMRRKLISTLVLGAGSLALAACGGGSDAGSVADSVANRQRRNRGSNSSSSTSASSSTPASSTASASTSNGSAGTGNTSTSGTVLDTSFGVKGDGSTNDRVALQNAIDGSVGQILMITGKSRIDAAGLTLHSNTHIRFAQGASIKLLSHNSSDYQIMRVWDVSNVNIEAPYLDGSKELNSAGSGESGMGISIAGSSNVTITSPTTIGCWGDGIYIANSYSGNNAVSKTISISDHHANGCRRQGATITSGNGITFTNPLWENISGTSPQCGLDIEPDNNNAVLTGIKIVSPTTSNTAGAGIQIYLSNLPGPVAKNVDIQITNHTDTGSPGGSYGVGGLSLNGDTVTGSITSSNPKWKSNWYFGQWDSAGPKVTVSNPTIS